MEDPTLIAAREALCEVIATLGERNLTHGAVDDQFALTALLWSRLFGIDVSPEQVARAMLLLKVSRMLCGEDDLDHTRDLMGYAALSAALSSKEAV